MDGTRVPRAAVWKYAYWAVVGGLFSIGLVGLLTVGIFFIAAGGVLSFVGFKSRALNNRSTTGMVAGLAVAPLVLAWINRHGPGTVCRAIENGTSCEDQYSPWPFVVVAVAIMIGFVAAVRRA